MCSMQGMFQSLNETIIDQTFLETSRQGLPNIRPLAYPKYEGETLKFNLKEFVTKLNAFYNSQQLTWPTLRDRHLHNILIGSAYTWWSNYDQSTISSFDQFIAALRAHFQGPQIELTLFNKIMTTKQAQNETPSDFITKMMKI